MYSLDMKLGGKLLDWQVLSAVQVFQPLRKGFSAVEHLTLEYDRDIMPSEWVSRADHVEWQEVLGSYDSVSHKAKSPDRTGRKRTEQAQDPI